MTCLFKFRFMQLTVSKYKLNFPVRVILGKETLIFSKTIETGK